MSKSSGSLFPSREKDPFLDRSYDPLLDESSEDWFDEDPAADALEEDAHHDRSSEASKPSEEWELSTFYPNVQSDVLERLARALNHDWSLRTVDLAPVASDASPGERSIQITFVLERRRVRSLFNVPRASTTS